MKKLVTVLFVFLLASCTQNASNNDPAAEKENTPVTETINVTKENYDQYFEFVPFVKEEGKRGSERYYRHEDLRLVLKPGYSANEELMFRIYTPHEEKIITHYGDLEQISVDTRTVNNEQWYIFDQYTQPAFLIYIISEENGTGQEWIYDYDKIAVYEVKGSICTAD